MPKILQLSPHIANLIAAGEVVERPASVVKELLENAVDAGASKVTVEIKNGGMTYLRVTDNGCGMSAEDARTAFLRHATSKLRTAEDLAAISTCEDSYMRRFAASRQSEDREKALEYLEKLREQILACEVLYNEEVLHVTMTYGIVEGRSEEAIEMSVKEADDLLYLGKTNGRNQIVSVPLER